MIRVGMGFDIHRFEEGRDLYLGGVKIDHPVGLKGHSDADVLLHAIIDALLGAAGLGDIGSLYPDTDPSIKGIRSTVMLEKVMEMLAEKGWRVGNLDAVVVCEKPKIVKWKEKIVDSLSALLSIPTDAISVKGKTAEKMGFVGREEGMVAQAVVLLEKEVK